MKKSKNLIAFEKAMSEHKGALLDFFNAWEKQQEASSKLSMLANSVGHGRTHIANAYHSLSPTEKKKVK